MSDSEKKNSKMFYGPVRLAETLDMVMKPVLKRFSYVEARIFMDWVNIAGEDVASCSAPQKVVFRRGEKTEGMLHLQVYASRALELQHKEPVILERIAIYFGYRAIGRLVFHQAPAEISVTKPVCEEKKVMPVKTEDFALQPEIICQDERLEQALKKLSRSLGGQKEG